MGFLEEIDTSGAPTIPEYFKGKTIFITGGSGYMGQALVEKLLYSCPELDRIYLLMRKKKGVLPEVRLEKLYTSSCFHRLRSEKPNIFMQKVHIVSGDVLELGLGLSDADRATLIHDVDIIFNVAASVRFDDPLTYAVKLNVRGTLQVIELAKEMKNLTSFVHISTCYSNCQTEVIDEVLYPPLADWREILEICDKIDEQTIRTLTPKYLNGIPNTYVFTKQLAEHMVSAQRGKLPIVILRPSIVIGSLQEPAPGWVNNFNGPCGLSIALGKEAIKHNKGSKVFARDLSVGQSQLTKLKTEDGRIISSKTELLEEVEKFYGQLLKETDDVPIYNLCALHEDLLTTQQINDRGSLFLKEYPLEGIVWHVRAPHVTNILLFHYFTVLIYNVSLAILIDFILWISGRQPRLMKIQRKIYIADIVLHYFLSKDWLMINTKFMAIRNKIKPEDKESFYYTVEKLFEDNYLETCFSAAKMYLLHEDHKDVAKTKAHAFRMKILHGFVTFLVYGTLLWWIVNTTYMKSLYYFIKTFCTV